MSEQIRVALVLVGVAAYLFIAGLLYRVLRARGWCSYWEEIAAIIWPATPVILLFGLGDRVGRRLTRKVSK